MHETDAENAPAVFQQLLSSLFPPYMNKPCVGCFLVFTVKWCDLYGEIVYTKNQPLIHASQNKTMTHHHLLFKQQNTEEIKFLLLN